MAEVIAPLVVANALNPSNLKIIYQKIKNRNFKIDSQDVSLYATMFVKFKSNLNLDWVNKLIIKSISKFETDKQSYYRVEQNVYSIISYYTYAQPSTDECLLDNEYLVYPDDPPCSLVPGVTGVTIYAFLESVDRSAIKNIRVVFNQIEEHLLKNIMIKQRGRFMYFDTTDKKVKKILNKKLVQEFKNNEEVFHDYSNDSDTELKLRYLESMHMLLAKIIK